MKINNKTYKEWMEDDLRTLLNNEDFRECQYLDYKRTFEFLESTDKSQKTRAKNEFRNDVCSFANADGGDLLFGISEKNGIASDIMPIAINNIDKFELELRNALLPIQPSMPSVEFVFISVGDRYVVVVHIEKGIFKPYMTLEDQTVFRFYVRHGNRKDAMSYSEISDSFLHVASLSADIKRFRLERLSDLLEDSTGMFGVVHVIPASFRNPADFIPICDLCKSGKVSMPYQFNPYVGGRMFPNVDGVWFPSEDGLRDFQLLRIFNNGSVELKFNLNITKSRNEIYLISDDFIRAISDVVEGTTEIYKALGRNATVYVCVSILGCKGYWNYISGVSIHPVASKIDRDRIICEPIEIKDISNGENVNEMIEECKKLTRYALGMKW